MRPLLLPKLMAARSVNASNESLKENLTGLYNSSDSVASDCSTPLTPTFTSRGHTRYPSSNSSLASTPPTFEYLTSTPSGSGKLPPLGEEPLEREDEFVVVENDADLAQCMCDIDPCEQSHRHPRQLEIITSPTPDYDLSDSFYGDDGDFTSQPLAKRRRSADSPVSSISNKLGTRFPSFSKRLKERKRSSLTAHRTSTPTRSPSSRSSSLTGAISPRFAQSEVQLPPTPARSIRDVSAPSSPVSPISIPKAADLDEEEEGREPYATTPLLPPTMVLRTSEETPLQSPLQSPTVAEPNASFSRSNTPAGTPHIPGVPTPPLSSKTSFSSVNRPGHLVPSSEIPPIMIADPVDKWAIKLGHANFTIYPEPYQPETCDAKSCRQLFIDWELARCNFMKHQVRTGEHFGVTSKTYKLTEDKWAEIDSLWREYNDRTVARAAEIGHERSAETPTEPAPIIKMPSLNDPKGEGKFPKLGDEDIVGPMVQIASQIRRKPSKRAALMKFFTGLKSPAAFLGRNAVGIRSSR